VRDPVNLAQRLAQVDEPNTGDSTDREPALEEEL
jgi:hypothetical protein